MSIRAYKIQKVEYQTSPTFNVSHLPDGAEFWANIFDQLNEDCCGYISIGKQDILDALDVVVDSEAREVLTAIMADFCEEDDYIEYYCF